MKKRTILFALGSLILIVSIGLVYFKPVWRTQAMAYLGSSSHQLELGRMYAMGSGITHSPKPEEAVHWYAKAAAQGDIEAEYYLGISYLTGIGIKSDVRKALGLLTSAASKSEPRSQVVLAGEYLSGEHIPVDYNQSFYLAQQAINSGKLDATPMADNEYATTLGNAESITGWLYESGNGVSQDYQKAFTEYSKAAKYKNTLAYMGLAGLYDRGMGVREDQSKAFGFWLLAANDGDSMAQFNVANSYLDGIGILKNLQKAINFFTASANQGFANAQESLGQLYEKGEGVKADNSAASEWYRKAAEQGRQNSQISLANMYAKGLGVPQNYQAAYMWATIARVKSADDASNLMAGLTFLMSHEQIERAQDMAAKWWKVHGQKSS